MLEQKEVDKLKEYCLEKVKARGYDSMEFDVSAELDSNITFLENQSILNKKIDSMFPNVNADIGKIGKKIDTNNKQMVAFFEKEQFAKIEKEAEENFMKSLEAIENDKQSSIIEQIYFIPKSLARMVSRNQATGLILVGQCGLGKTYTVLRAFKEEGKDFVYSCGFTSALELYTFLYENRTKHIIFDDVSNLMKSAVILDMLKSALFSPKGIRMVQYNTTSPRLKVPNKFEFTGTLTILLNKLGNNEDIKAVADRVLYYEMNLDYLTKLKVLFELSKQEYKGLTKETRQEIVRWIKDNTTKATKNLNLRLLYKVYDLYLFDNKYWDLIAKEMIDDDKDLLFLKKLLEKSHTIKMACEEYVNEGYGSRASFYRLKRKL